MHIAFRLVALGEHNKILIRKKFSRAQLLAYTACSKAADHTLSQLACHQELNVNT
jgi:hypothetical protein